MIETVNERKDCSAAMLTNSCSKRRVTENLKTNFQSFEVELPLWLWAKHLPFL